MKRLSNPFNHLLLILTLGAMTVPVIQGCAIAGVKVSGRVIDIGTGQPIEGAYVYAESGHKDIRILDTGGLGYTIVDAALARTDKHGFYQFDERFKFGSTLASKFGTVIVYKPGYITAPKMIAKNWKSDIGETAEAYVAGYIPSQYFYGSGDYSDDYNEVPLNKKHSIYYLSSRPVGKLQSGISAVPPSGFGGSDVSEMSPRLIFIANALNQITGSPRSIKPMKIAMYREAKDIAVPNASDQSMLLSICLKAHNRNVFDDSKRCP